MKPGDLNHKINPYECENKVKNTGDFYFDINYNLNLDTADRASLSGFDN